MISHRQRLEACLAGAPLDRTPVALWRHFPVDDQTPDGLAAATLAFQRTYDFDLVKVTPASSFCLKDWGAQDDWRGASEGTRFYTHHVIKEPADWNRLTPLDPRAGYLGMQITCVRTITEALGSDTPVLQTIFSPLAQAKNLVGGEQLLAHMRRDPEALHAGLRILTENTRRFIEAARQTGIAGVFYAVQHAQYSLLSEEEFQVFGRSYDLQALEPAQDLWCNMLHLHGVQVMFDQILDYPVQAINWHDRDTFPSLEQARERYRGILCGGLQREQSIVLGTPESITAEARQAIQATNGERFILGTGCVTPITAPYGNLWAARRSVEF
jgi:uroporphyrinogen decarboxylase